MIFPGPTATAPLGVGDAPMWRMATSASSLDPPDMRSPFRDWCSEDGCSAEGRGNLAGRAPASPLETSPGGSCGSVHWTEHMPSHRLVCGGGDHLPPTTHPARASRGRAEEGRRGWEHLCHHSVRTCMGAATPDWSTCSSVDSGEARGGHIASYLAPEYDVLLRVGGPNAGHQVYREEGALTCHHLPSGTQENEWAKVVIGPGAVIRVPDLLSEIADSGRTSSTLHIDPNAMVIEDIDLERENQGSAAGEGVSEIGSTRRGVGEATARKVLRPRANPKIRLARCIRDLKQYLRPTLEILDDAFRAGQRVFLEGTQGTGLSLHHGSYPHVTSRDTTVSGCLAEAGVAPGRVRRVVMVVRSYPIRVKGPSGPMGRQISWAEVARRARIHQVAQSRLDRPCGRLPSLLRGRR